MLVLGRNPGESVTIVAGKEKIVITVVEMRSGKVRLGFEAHQAVRILRTELLDRQATAGDTSDA